MLLINDSRNRSKTL